MAPPYFDIGLNLQNTHVLVTGGAGLIGRSVVSAFLAAGASVTSLDLAYPGPEGVSQSLPELAKIHPELGDDAKGDTKLQFFRANTTDEKQLVSAWSSAVDKFGIVQCCVALAAKDMSVLPHTGLVDMTPEQWNDTLGVNVGGTMLVARQWLRGLRDAKGTGALSPAQNVGLIMVGSESGWFGEKTNPDYAASKAAVQVGLLQSLKAEVPRVFDGARVNAIAPGGVDTARFKQECIDDPKQYYLDAQATVAMKKPVPVESVAKAILYLASDNLSGLIHGQVLNIDGGKQGKLMWAKEECE